MKKYLMSGLTAIVFSGMMISCSHNTDFGGNDVQKNIQANYEKAFTQRFGEPAPEQDWGFGTSSASKAMTRSMAAPACPDITKPYDEDWVAEYLETAKEPTSANTWDNYDNGHFQNASLTLTTEPALPSFNWGSKLQNAAYNGGNACSEEEMNFYNNVWTPLFSAYNSASLEYHPADKKVDSFNAKIDLFKSLYDALVNSGLTVSDWMTSINLGTKGAYSITGGTWVADNDYVTNFKITGTYSGYINVAASEGIMDGGALSGAERTIVVTGTWNITEDQRIGSLGKIIIANGGTVNVANGKTLNMVNQARLVVLPGGRLTGKGKVEVNNGNAEGQENYNGGTIDVATFNNNFGKFYNYGKFLVNEYQGGAQESNFYNHSLVVIDHFAGTGSTANARVFNACQFYVKNNARIRNYEGIQGSALIVGKQLMFSSSEDGTSTPTYVGLAAGALVKAGSLYNNGTSWTGPTEGGYAVLTIGQFDYMNWQQDHPEEGGYFANNIYLQADILDNVPDGNGYHQTDASDTQNHALSIAEYKFKNIVANAVGNGNVRIIEKGSTEIIPADEDFNLGVEGCTPGFNGDIPPVTPPSTDDEWEEIRIIAEDLTINDAAGISDFDFNDIVFDVKRYTKGAKTGTVEVILRAAGGTLPLYLSKIDPEWEVHKLFGVVQSVMVNTNAVGGASKPIVTKTLDAGTYSGTTIQEIANSIKIIVTKNGENVELTAVRGKVASKIAVGTDYDWCNERQDIDQKYSLSDGTSLFGEYVQGRLGLNGKKWYKGE